MYERNFLMQMRQSPLAKTPPANLPVIPGVTVPASTSPNKNCASSPKKTNDSSAGDAERRTSSMDCPSKLQAVPGMFFFLNSQCQEVRYNKSLSYFRQQFN